MNRQVLDELKRQIPLLEYLHVCHWQQGRPIGSGRFLGLPLHPDHQPSLLVDPNKNLFYCYGCRRGGDIVRFVELYHQVKFPQALALLRQSRRLAPLLPEAVSFYRIQLHRHREAVAYLYERGARSPELIETMRIGYAPGGCFRQLVDAVRLSPPGFAPGWLGHLFRLRFRLSGQFLAPLR